MAINREKTLNAVKKKEKERISTGKTAIAVHEASDSFNKPSPEDEKREALLSYDLVAGENDIRDIETRLSSLKSEKNAYEADYKKNGGYVPTASNYNRPSVAQGNAYQAFVAKSGSYQKEIEELENSLAEKKTYHNRAKHYQTVNSLATEAVTSKDFKINSQKGKDNDVAVKRDEYANKYGNDYNKNYEFGEATLSLEDRFAKYATDEEMSIYSYYVGKGDEVSAQAFLTSMEESINARKGTGMYEDVEDNTALELAFGAAAGFQQFGVGVGNIFTDKDYYVPTATQMAGASVREDLADNGPVLPDFLGGSSLGQVGYDVINTTANMLPSILLSSAVTYATGGIATPAVASALGGAVGSVALGTSAAGNAYAEMINLGYDKGQARTYAAMVGGSEAGLQYLFGGIGKLGGKLTSKSIGAVVNNIDNAFAKAAIKFGGNMISEGFEEYAQEILDPFFKNIAFNENNEINLLSSEAIYSGVLGALTAGFLEGTPGAVASGINAAHTYQTGKTITQQKDFDVTRLKELGKTMSADSVAYKIADKVNENTGAYTIGKLFHSIGAELSVQNKADIVKSLTRKGVAEKNANTIAEWLAATVSGAKLTKRQINALEMNEDIATTFRDVVINKNSTVNQRRQALFEAGGINVYAGEDIQAVSNESSPDAIGKRVAEKYASTNHAPTMSDYHAVLSMLAAETANKETDPDVPMVEKVEPFALLVNNAGKPNTMRTPIEDAVAKEHKVSSVEGETILTSTNEAVSIKKIASIDGNKMTLELDDGRTVSSKDVSYGSQGEALVYEAVANMDVPVDVEKANTLVSMYKPTSKQSAVSFVKGIEEAYRYGYFGIPKAEMLARTSFTLELTSEQRETAYRLGGIMSETRVKESTKNVAKGKKGAVGKGKVHFEGSTKGLSQRQKSSLKALEVIAEVTGLQIEVFESPVVNGKRVGKNGYYDPKTGKMGIDLYAGRDGNGLMLFTAAHELGHHIKNWSPAKFKILADFLMEQYGEKGVSVDTLVKRQIAKAKANGRTLTYEEAYEEVVCDSLETMLADGAVIEKLKLLATKDKSLVNKIKSFLNELVAKIKQAYEGLKPDSTEGQIVAEMVDATERLHELFVEALMDATENYTSAQDNGVVYGEGNFAKLSDRYWYPNMSKTDLDAVRRIAKHEVSKTDNYLDKVTKWLYNTRNGNTYFALYSTENSEDPTILYACKDSRAKKEYEWFITRRNYYEAGTRLRTTSGNINEMLGIYGSSAFKSSMYRGNAENRSGKSGNDTAYKGKTRFEPGRALLNCLENIKEEQEQGKVKLSDRDPDAITPRSLLANALEGTVQNDIERKKLTEYKKKIELMNAEEVKLADLRKQIKEGSFSKDKRDSEKLKQLQEDATETANRISTYDRQLLNLESTQALKNVLEREKKKAVDRQKAKDKEILQDYRRKADEKHQKTVERYQESRKKAVEGRHKTEMRNKIKKVVNELNQYLLNGTKDKHVMIGMQKAVAEALSIVNMDTVGADERVAKYDALIAEATDPDIIESLTATRDRIAGQGDRLSDKLTSLQSAYSNIINSTDPLIANAHDEVVEAKIASVAEVVGNTSIRDMSMSQLEEVYDLYRMVLTNIRNANKLFNEARQETVEELGYSVYSEIQDVTKRKDRMLAIQSFARKMGYKELKPIYFFRMLGSDTMSSLYKSVRDGQNTWYTVVSDAKMFRMETEKDFGYKKWDFDKKHTFTAKSGKNFDLTLPQIMSIYAFSRREQAFDHLIKGGIVFDDAVKVKEKKKGIPLSYTVNTSDAFNLSEFTLGEIIATLTDEQKRFVEAMQTYLSDTMGEKGNEVSLELYGVKIFKEKNYFSLKSSQYYMSFTAEEAGETKIKNSSFSKETVKHANNPIVLSDFMDVWTAHVNDMAMYHAFVLPLEDFTRVYNYRTPTTDGSETTSVKSTIHNHFTESANDYIKQLLKDINGGSVSGVGTQIIDKMIGLAKKGAVFASASVVVQQPSAIFRTMAYVNPKYFVNAPSLSFRRHSQLWEECKRYAPIAGIKEMGYFDTSVGQTGIDWIRTDEYNSMREKLFAFFKDKEQRGNILDDALSKAPAMADELAWVALWKAIKKETKKTTDLKVGSEEFFKHCGERFTEVVDLTQVYDSVFSRSELMRSKDRMVKASTAFMSEPTTQVNMLFDAALQLKRKGKAAIGAAVSVVASVVASMVVNSLLKSVVLAGRDDDEDETYLEKYVASFTGDVLNGMNPLTLVPFVKDIISIIQGYSVDRMDMSVIDALITSVMNFGKDTKTDYEKWTGFIGAVAQLFGVPAKNIIRDINTAVNTFNTFTSGNTTTKTGLVSATKEGLSGTVTATLVDALTGKGIDTSKGKQYYDAVMNGDTAHADRIVASYGDAKKADNAIVKALKDFDPRVAEAAQAQVNGDNATRIRLSKEIIADGFKQDYVVKAVNSAINALDKGESEDYSLKAQSLYSKDDYFEAAYNGETSNANTYKEEIISAYMENNSKTREEAESSFNSNFRSSVKEAVIAGKLTAEKATRMLADFGGLDEEKAYENAQYYEFLGDNPELEYNWGSDTVAKYLESAEPAGISVKDFDDYLVRKAECAGADNNGDGKTDSGSKKAQILRVINSLAITSRQKDVLYRLNGWAESKLYEAPWH